MEPEDQSERKQKWQQLINNAEWILEHGYGEERPERTIDIPCEIVEDKQLPPAK